MRSGFMLLSVLILSACAVTPRSYQYTLPETKEGQACAAECKSTIDACRTAEQKAYEKCLHERVFAIRQHDTCERARGVEGQEGSCLPVPLCEAPDIIQCTQNYNACFETCGGGVEAIR